jgi:hypothetical protein
MDVNNDDFYDYDNNNGTADEDSSLGEGVAHGFVMAFVMKRPMTQRELDADHEKREKAVDMVMEKANQFEEKGEAKRK